MGKKTVFTNITSLPSQVSREAVTAMLQNHAEMINLNPLVVEYHAISTPANAAKDEFVDCAWYEMTDKIPLPGGMMKKKVTYQGCFHNIPNGLQTHVYAPLGVNIRETWKVCGSLAEEPVEPRELGLNTPRKGLYIREDCELKSSILLTGTVRKNLDFAHRMLIERVLARAGKAQAVLDASHIQDHTAVSISSSLEESSAGTSSMRQRPAASNTTSKPQVRMMESTMPSSSAMVTPAGAPERDNTVQQSTVPMSGMSQNLYPRQSVSTIYDDELRNVHPALREQYIQQQDSGSARHDTSLPAYSTVIQQTGQLHHEDMVKTPGDRHFAVELEGSTPERPGSNFESLNSARDDRHVTELADHDSENDRPQTVYGPVSEVSDDVQLQHERLPSHLLFDSRDQYSGQSFTDGNDLSRSSMALRRFSVVSGVSAPSTPKLPVANSSGHRYSTVSELSETSTPQFHKQTFAFAQQEARLAQQRHLDKFN